MYEPIDQNESQAELVDLNESQTERIDQIESRTELNDQNEPETVLIYQNESQTELIYQNESQTELIYQKESQTELIDHTGVSLDVMRMSSLGTSCSTKITRSLNVYLHLDGHRTHYRSRIQTPHGVNASIDRSNAPLIHDSLCSSLTPRVEGDTWS
jgi:hypothetical protein